MFVVLYGRASFNFMTIKCVIMFILYNLLVFSFRNYMDFYQIMRFNAKLDIIYIKFVYQLYVICCFNVIFFKYWEKLNHINGIRWV